MPSSVGARPSCTAKTRPSAPIQAAARARLAATRVVGTTDDEGDDSPEYDTDEDGYVSFGQNGFRRMGDGTLPAALAIVLCDERGNVPSSSGPDVSTARAIEVSTAGRAAISRDRDRIEILGGCP